ncbi:commd3 [Acrasis kona]|uniref:COMM domain-containing protein 3 n=1 Tax=Acrasis kona TaxID=1008807 RepID=A0AAW2YM06_9EUKA
MDIKADARLALSQLSNTSTYNEQTFRELVDSVVKTVIKSSQEEYPTSNIPSEQKIIFSALVYLFVEASKHNAESLEMSNFLVEHILEPDRVQYICDQYTANKDLIREKALKNKTFAFPKLVDVDWRLDYVVKSSSVQKTNEPVYTLNFRFDDGEAMKLSCTVEQLQDLHSKMRDAVKQVERTLEK